MKKIYVYSTTGNSLAGARIMAETLGDTEILSIPEVMKQKSWSIQGDYVGFSIPCYYGTIPNLVKEFIVNAREVKIGTAFGLITSGGSTGYGIKHLNRLLMKRGSRLSAARTAAIASNYMNGWYYSLILPSESRLKRRVKMGRLAAERVANDVLSGRKGVERGSWISYLMPNLLAPARYIQDTRPWDSEFSVGTACRKCGICAKICPVENIEISEGAHRFNHNCQRCMACIQHCPASAFSIEGVRMNKPRYNHPDVSLGDLLTLKKTE